MLTIYVDMDDVLCDFSGARNEALTKNPDVKYPQSQLDFFRKLEPKQGAVKGLSYLLENHNTYIATAPSICNPLCYTEKALWIKDHFGVEVLNRLIIVPNKSLLKGDYLIDDRSDTHKQNEFEGKLLLFGSAQFPDWYKIVAYFTNNY